MQKKNHLKKPEWKKFFNALFDVRVKPIGNVAFFANRGLIVMSPGYVWEKFAYFASSVISKEDKALLNT